MPTQTQMDFFSEYYDTEFFDIVSFKREEEELSGGKKFIFEYKSGTLYNPDTHETQHKHKKTGKYSYHMSEEKDIWLHGHKVTVIRDTKTMRILAWHKVDDNYLGSQV